MHHDCIFWNMPQDKIIVSIYLPGGTRVFHLTEKRFCDCFVKSTRCALEHVLAVPDTLVVCFRSFKVLRGEVCVKCVLR